ncbi:MAG: hypothetical protein HQK57_15710 [Deltaproteobacteria bacterium]|nr:hypothetical protein [Deltaproteobacteria bacterium]
MVEAMEQARQNGFEVHTFFVKRHGLKIIDARTGGMLQDTFREPSKNNFQKPQK